MSSDPDLIGRALAGDLDAFEALVRRHYDSAFAFALACTCSREDAEDVCQDAFVLASRRLAQCRERERFAAWLFTIVRNRAHNLRRAQRRRVAEPLDGVVLASDDDPARDAERSELRQSLERELARLTPAQREVVLLHDLKEWTHPEIARALGISETMSRQHLFVARRGLRQRLQHSLMEINNDV